MADQVNRMNPKIPMMNSPQITASVILTKSFILQYLLLTFVFRFSQR